MGGAFPAPADPPRALFAAGGTGGHIWPAVAVSRALKSHDPRWQCHFVGGDRPVEAEVYAAAGVSPAVIHVPP
ncbi:MAG: glycosyltransferase, partial [Saprospiraceae bacterium]|nr:glycosyltransferase [Saprospiraceae bacterium]